MAFPTTSVLDAFNRADANPLTGSWANYPRLNTGRFQTLSNVARPGNLGITCAEHWTGATYGPDTEVGCTITSLPTNVGERFELLLRANNPTLTTSQSYRMRVAKAASGYDWTIWFLDTATSTQISAAPTNTALAVGDQIGFEAIGTTLTGYRKPSAGSWAQVLTDSHSTLSAAGYIAAAMNADAAGIDDFFGGTVAAGGAPVGRRRSRSLIGV